MVSVVASASLRPMPEHLIVGPGSGCNGCDRIGRAVIGLLEEFDGAELG
jgi:hypothetical protein